MSFLFKNGDQSINNLPSNNTETTTSNTEGVYDYQEYFKHKGYYNLGGGTQNEQTGATEIDWGFEITEEDGNATGVEESAFEIIEINQNEPSVLGGLAHGAARRGTPAGIEAAAGLR